MTLLFTDTETMQWNLSEAIGDAGSGDVYVQRYVSDPFTTAFPLSILSFYMQIPIATIIFNPLE